ncbi:DUF1702 family protein [Tropicibacter sp. S64]|uniref:DUF1702 family protein n=1 Tax=Tropicibacter sp. S64 TaxID=3415122 RepID=UPI003C7B809B
MSETRAGTAALDAGQQHDQGGLGLLSVLRIDLREALFETRGFAARDGERQARLERSAGAFVAGYNRALYPRGMNDLLDNRDLPRALRGFSVEGSAMALAITDAFPFRLIRGARLEAFLAAAAANNPYLAAVGAGWAMAKTPWRTRAILRALDPVLVSLAFDGLGFHDCFFHPERFARGAPKRLGPLAAQSWDRGAGRALWFASGGDAAKAWETLTTFAPARRSDVAAGLGLAMTYAGGLPEDEAAAFAAETGDLRRWLAQGSAFALEAHVRAGTDTPPVQTTFAALSGVDPETGLRLVRQAMPSAPAPLPLAEACALHEGWRERLSTALTDHRKAK